ncbi:hypothetical protein PCK2_000953 [Pneumocystis canis]|nr:hypothetical protein PCK2_000953 [Pneumocystis canis]
MPENIKDYVENLITTHSVVIFSKSFCPDCYEAKDLFDRLGVKYHALELDKMDEGSDIQSYLFEKTDQRTVPNIFINTQHVGGNSDLKALHNSGNLDQYFK